MGCYDDYRQIERIKNKNNEQNTAFTGHSNWIFFLQ